MTNEKRYRIVKSAELDGSEKDFDIEIEWETISTYRQKAIRKLSEGAELPGFRKGHVPEKVIIEKMGEAGVLEESLDLWVKTELPEFIIAEVPDAVAMPKITVTKIAPGNPVGLKITIAVKPKFILADYKKISASENNKQTKDEFKVDDKEIEEATNNLRRALAGHKRGDNAVEPKTGDQETLPELTLDLVKQFGEFKTLDEFKEKIKENILADKKEKAKQKNRLAIMEKIIAGTKGSVPKDLVDRELDKMESEFRHDIERMGLKFEDYQKKINKTAEEMKKDWRDDAEKRVKVQFLTSQIAVDEKIVPDREAVSKEVEHLIKHYKDADPERAREYVTTVMTNEKVFEFLESQK